MRLLRPQLILSLCDYTGEWSRPYREDDYDVIQVDLGHGQDVRLMELPSKPVHGVLAAPPCTVFANSAGKLSRYLGPPRMTFQPNQYGDDYTKFTCLWGDFNTPTKTPVPATAGSKMHFLPPSEDRAALRSVTPAGFSAAFFEANP
jgi:hypothetical protein